MENKIKLHQAKLEELQLIEGMLTDTAKWLKSIGSKQWNGILEGKDNHNTANAIEKGEVFYCTLENKPVGMFILWQNQSEWDQELWGTEDSEAYFYLHRLNLVREFAGKGIALDMLERIKEYGKVNQKTGIRLDCLASNEPLNQMYKKANFNFLKTIYNHDAGEQISDFNLYEYLYK
ncbi:GNAT family N-acetyltransferase [Carnobacterium gallinarum]|uniref:GNAT family N-acetyltransferase n=1 Tax=Carnobacterium gallinarum TaxID=2749 RepID=UPI000550F212|nr:GNAT family N-acetyltransferase [Carnobacterium gallinarum]